MDTHTSEQASQAATGHTVKNGHADTPLPAGTSSNNSGRIDPPHEPLPMLKRRVTPSTFKLDETPEERDARIRDLRETLDSLRAKTPEEAEEQRETWKYLKAALDKHRPPYAKLFADE